MVQIGLWKGSGWRILESILGQNSGLFGHSLLLYALKQHTNVPWTETCCFRWSRHKFRGSMLISLNYDMIHDNFLFLRFLLMVIRPPFKRSGPNVFVTSWGGCLMDDLLKVSLEVLQLDNHPASAWKASWRK